MMLTNVAIRNAKPKDRAFKLYDTGGLFLLVNPNGSRWWRFRYRFAGRDNALAIGVYPEVSLKAARAKREEARTLLNGGNDPSAERKAEKLRKVEEMRKQTAAVENSFEKVAREWHKQNIHTWTPGYWKKAQRRLEMNLFPFIGDRSISEIKAPDLLAVVRGIESRGAFDLAHKMTQVFGQVARYAIATGRAERDISRDLRGALVPHHKKPQAAVKPDELPELLRAIAHYEDIGGEKQTRLVLEMMAMTFTRTRELIEAEWPEINFDAAMWTIPASRMKMGAEHLVPLAQQAIEILKELQELSGGSRFVFPGRNRHSPTSYNTALFALYRMGYRGRQTGHGFRAIASTILNEQGWRADVIERQLSHGDRDPVRAAYNRAQYLPERVEMMQAWADYLDAARDGAKVLPIRGKVA